MNGWKPETANAFAAPSSTSPSATFCALTSEETASRLHTSLSHGLDAPHDVNYRRSVHGTNELTGEESESLAVKFAQQFYENPLILLLIGSAVISYFMGNKDDAISITLAILIVVSVGFVQEYRSEQSLQALNKLVPPSCHVTRGTNTNTIMAASLVPGDLVFFSVGDRVPADVRITRCAHLEIDESNLTGEPDPVHKTSDPVVPQYPSGILPVSERNNIAYMGTLVCSGNGEGIVVGTGRETEFGTVFGMMSDISKPKTPLQMSMDVLGKELSMVSFGAIGLICIVGVVQGRAWLDMFQISVSLAVAAIPEGLPIIVTVTLALGVLRMASEKAIMRRLPSVETLGSVNVICTDKTGTLTQNHMTVTKLWTVGQEPWTGSLDGVGIPNGSVNERSPAITTLLQVGNFCNNAKFSQEKNTYLGNPTDIALVEVLSQFGLEDARNTRARVSETPFSSSLKWMSVVVHGGDKSSSTIYVKGGLDRVYNFCTSYVDNSGKTALLDATIRDQIFAMEKSLAHGGARILAMAYGAAPSDSKPETVTQPQDLTFAGLVGMYDPPRSGVSQSIRSLMQGGVRVVMITGDSESTAESIARQVGIPMMGIDGERSIMTGDVLERLPPNDLAAAIGSVTVFARTSPENKLSIVRALQTHGDIVAMTGDGVNDAPALKLADIGISMGQGGTDVAKEAADMILVDDDFSTILSAIREGKAIFSNIQSFLTFQLSTSIAALSLVALATILQLENPLNAMQILWINILMDGPPAQSLGVEPVDPAVMTRPPRSRNDRVLTRQIGVRILQSAAIIVAGTMFIYLTEMSADNMVTARDTTMTFTCFVLFDMFNALACRSATKSAFEIGFFTNKMFNLAVGGSLMGQLAVIYVPSLQRVFQTEALSLKDLLMLIALTSTVWLADEAKKYFKRRDALTGYSNSV